MSERECANCGSEIEPAPTILFCDEYCCQQYLNAHGRLPEVGEL